VDSILPYLAQSLKVKPQAIGPTLHEPPDGVAGRVP
jgi:hypothetical protein